MILGSETLTLKACAPKSREPTAAIGGARGRTGRDKRRPRANRPWEPSPCEQAKGDCYPSPDSALRKLAVPCGRCFSPSGGRNRFRRNRESCWLSRLLQVAKCGEIAVLPDLPPPKMQDAFSIQSEDLASMSFSRKPGCAQRVVQGSTCLNRPASLDSSYSCTHPCCRSKLFALGGGGGVTRPVRTLFFVVPLSHEVSSRTEAQASWGPRRVRRGGCPGSRGAAADVSAGGTLPSPSVRARLRLASLSAEGAPLCRGISPLASPQRSSQFHNFC